MGVDSGVVTSVVVAVNICPVVDCEFILVVSDVVIHVYFVVSTKVVVIFITDFKCSFESRGKTVHYLPPPQKDAVFISDGSLVRLFFGSQHALDAPPELFAVVGG